MKEFLLSGLRKVMQKTLDEFEPARLNLATGEAAVAEWAAMERLACAGKLQAAARVDELGLDADQAVATSSGITAGAARRQTRLHKKLKNKQKTAERFAKGKLSATQANAIADAVELDPDAEADLLGLAEKASTADLISACDQVRRNALDADGSLAARQRSLRSLRTWRDALGMTCVSAKLTPIVGAKFVAEIQRRVDRLFREQARAKDRVVDTPDQRGADALDQILDSIERTPTGKRRGPRTVVNLIVSKAAAERGRTEGDEKCETDHGTPIPVSALDDVFTDPDTVVKEFEFVGVDVTTMKTYKRYIPARLQDVLNAKGKRCSVCGATQGLERDHREELRDGGATESRNLGWKCRNCHPLKTDRKYVEVPNAAGGYDWVPNPSRAAPSRASPD